MPRHRIEAPRHRTLWPAAVRSARRVLFRAASSRRETPGHAKPYVTPEWRRRLSRSQRRMLKQAGRRLVASPWFAAGAGFVIATSAIIYAPHNQLSPAINITQCQLASCAKLAPQAQAPGLPAGSGAHLAAPKPSLPPGVTFWYQPGHSTGDLFSMWIEIHGQHSLGQWQLSFVIPGARGIYVYWPHWDPYGSHGVTVTSYYAGTESAGYAQISAHESGGADGPSRGGYTVLFQLRGTGTPRTPVGCTYKGAVCTFRLSESLAQADSLGSR